MKNIIVILAIYIALMQNRVTINKNQINILTLFLDFKNKQMI